MSTEIQRYDVKLSRAELGFLDMLLHRLMRNKKGEAEFGLSVTQWRDLDDVYKQVSEECYRVQNSLW